MKQTYVLEGDIYPYVRTTQRQKWVDPRWAKYVASQEAIRRQVESMMGFRDWTMFPKVPLRLGVVMQVSGGMHKRDASNILKAIEDALQKLVYSNDAWLDEISLSRMKGEEDRALVMIGEVAEWGAMAWLSDLWLRAAMHDVLVR